MLTILITSELACPMIRCDLCGKLIHQKQPASAIWNADQEPLMGWLLGTVTLAHEHCAEAAKLYGPRSMNQPLGEFLAQLLINWRNPE